MVAGPASCTVARYPWPQSPSRCAAAPPNPAPTAPRRKSLTARPQRCELVPPPAGPVHAGVRRPPAAARPEWFPPDHSWVWVRPDRGPVVVGPHLRSCWQPLPTAPQGPASPGPLTMPHRAVRHRPYDPPAPPAHQMAGLHRSRVARSRACLSRCDLFRPQSRKHPLIASPKTQTTGHCVTARISLYHNSNAPVSPEAAAEFARFLSRRADSTHLGQAALTSQALFRRRVSHRQSMRRATFRRPR